MNRQLLFTLVTIICQEKKVLSAALFDGNRKILGFQKLRG
jgi:hypothetical protein